MMNLHSFEEACDTARVLLKAARQARIESAGFQPHLVNYVTAEGDLIATLMPPPPVTRDVLLMLGSEIQAQYAVVIVEGMTAKVGSMAKVGAVMMAVEAGATAEEALAGHEMGTSLMAILEHPMGIRVWVCEPTPEAEVRELNEAQIPAGKDTNPLHNITGCGPGGAIAEAWAQAVEATAE